MRRWWTRAAGACVMAAVSVGIILTARGLMRAQCMALQNRPGVELYGETTLVTAREGQRELFDAEPRTLTFRLYLDPQADSRDEPEAFWGNLLFGVVTDEGAPFGGAPVQLFRDEVQFDLSSREIFCEDVNFDGYPDIYYRVMRCGPTQRYSFWCWEPRLQRFVHNDALSAISSPSFSEDGTVRSWARGSALDHYCDIYAYQGGELTCVRRWSYTGAGGDVRLFCEDWAGGRWQTVFEAFVPYEAISAIWEDQEFPAAYAAHERYYRYVEEEFSRHLDRFYRGGVDGDRSPIKMEQIES